jgi:hypothetical protein
MKKLDFISTSTAITGYADSKLAKTETRDCVVRAIASASGMSYDKAHSFVADKFGRKPRKGTYGFIPGMNYMVTSGEKLNRKGVKKVDIITKTKTGMTTMTVNKFAENYTSGSYIVTVKGHAFTIKDGKVVGNFNDAIQIRKKIVAAWKIGTR